MDSVGAGPPSGARSLLDRRTVVAAAATAVVLLAAVVAGLASSSDGGAPVIFVNRVSSAIGEVVTRAGSGFWWSYAFLLGAVAAFNPCGFALLPAYLGLYLSADGDGRSGLASRARRSLMVAVVVATSFTALFGAMGAVFAIGSAFAVRSLPWAGLAVGVVLILIGGVTLTGRSVVQRVPQTVADKLGKGAGRRNTRGYAAFGLAYGVASLGCTLPLFLALMGTAVAAAGTWAAVMAFALYGAGMATVLGVLTVVAGLMSLGVVSRVRTITRAVAGVSSALLLLSGAYVVYYWLSAGRLLLG
jgi:cytochrome c biogenesis protein CcdA